MDDGEIVWHHSKRFLYTSSISRR